MMYQYLPNAVTNIYVKYIYIYIYKYFYEMLYYISSGLYGGQKVESAESRVFSYYIPFLEISFFFFLNEKFK